jgi:elongation factor G
MHSA